jgi:hypothetical protein
MPRSNYCFLNMLIPAFFSGSHRDVVGLDGAYFIDIITLLAILSRLAGMEDVPSQPCGWHCRNGPLRRASVGLLPQHFLEVDRLAFGLELLRPLLRGIHTRCCHLKLNLSLGAKFPKHFSEGLLLPLESVLVRSESNRRNCASIGVS